MDLNKTTTKNKSDKISESYKRHGVHELDKAKKRQGGYGKKIDEHYEKLIHK
jgi:hypothetical protein